MVCMREWLIGVWSIDLREIAWLTVYIYVVSVPLVALSSDVETDVNGAVSHVSLRARKFSL